MILRVDLTDEEIQEGIAKTTEKVNHRTIKLRGEKPFPPEPNARHDWKDNQVIQQSRQVALEILKPGKKALEHGLELHADSLVFDNYGFAPRAAIDGDVMAQAVEAGASTIELKDMREDMSMTRFVSDSAERAEFEQAWNASGVTCIFQNAGEEGQEARVAGRRGGPSLRGGRGHCPRGRPGRGL